MSSPIRTPEQPPLSVTPLNSMPYVDPITSLDDDNNSAQPQGDVELVEPARPISYLFYSQPTEELHDKNLSEKAVCLGGNATIGMIAEVLGKMDISESKDSYLFRVALPGVSRDEFTCDVTPDGKIVLKGVTTTGEKIVYKNSMKFEMQSQNLCPAGHFSISFMLPGPVDSHDLTGHFGIDGIFEGKVKKKHPSA